MKELKGVEYTTKEFKNRIGLKSLFMISNINKNTRLKK